MESTQQTKKKRETQSEAADKKNAVVDKARQVRRDGVKEYSEKNVEKRSKKEVLIVTASGKQKEKVIEVTEYKVGKNSKSPGVIKRRLKSIRTK